MFDSSRIPFEIAFSLNNLKTGIIALISYKISYKESTKKRGELAILLLSEYKKVKEIKLKSARKTTKTEEGEE